MTITIDGEDTPEHDCVYDVANGKTACVPVNSNGTANNTNTAGTTGTGDGNSNTTTGTGTAVTPPRPLIIPTSSVNPNPSKDDLGCSSSDPTKGGGCASQDTAIKTNQLISETNSKLGSLASSNATNASFLASIYSKLDSIFKQNVANSAGTGTGTGSGTGTGTGSGTTPCAGSDCSYSTGGGTGSGGVSDLNNTSKQVAFTNPAPVVGSCPADIPVHVMGANLAFSYEPICNFSRSIHGVVTAMGALSAVLIVITAL